MTSLDSDAPPGQETPPTGGGRTAHRLGLPLRVAFALVEWALTMGPVLYLTMWPITLTPVFAVGVAFTLALYALHAPFPNAARESRPLGGVLVAAAVGLPLLSLPLLLAAFDVTMLWVVWRWVLVFGVLQLELSLASWVSDRLFPAVDEFLNVRLVLVGRVRQALLGFAGVCALAIAWFAGFYLFIHRRGGEPAFANVPADANGWSFVCFSLLTAVTLGYTDIKPISPLAQAVVAAEAVLFVALTVVIFGLLLMSFERRGDATGSTPNRPTGQWAASPPTSCPRPAAEVTSSRSLWPSGTS